MLTNLITYVTDRLSESVLFTPILFLTKKSNNVFLSESKLPILIFPRKGDAS